jgi:glutamate transport system substrate-binding protein
MRGRRWALGAAAALVAASTAACGIGGGSASVATKSTLTIGVKADQPGLGLRQNGHFSGFDVDVASYIAKKLGAKHVNFTPITSAQREKYLEAGTVDMVVATYSITPARKQLVTFGGPYYVAHQDTLVRSDETSIIHNVHDLKGKTLCNAKGSNSFARVATEKSIAAIGVPGASYSDCVGKLSSGAVQAVSTDDLILAGFAAEKGGTLKLVNQPFSDEKYGVGIKLGDIEGCEEINKAITDMYQDGTAAKLLHKWFDASGLEVNTNVPQFEGCG